MNINKYIITGGIIAFQLLSCIIKQGGKTDIKEEEIETNVSPSSIFDGVSLDGWEITNFVLPGLVYVSRGEILLEMGDGCTGITLIETPPEMEYQLSLDAKRVAGNDFFCGLTFPVNDYFCSLIVGGWGGSLVGLSCIDRKDASDNETTSWMTFNDNQWYHITVEVSNGKIKAVIDEQTVIDFTIGNHYLSVRPEVLKNIPLGIATWHTTAAIKNIRLEKITQTTCVDD